MFKSLCSASALVLIASFAHAEGLEVNLGGVGEKTGGLSAYGNITYSFDPHSRSGSYLRFSAVRSEYEYDSGGTVDGVKQRVVAAIGREFTAGDETFQVGVGFVLRDVSESGGLVDVDESETSFYAEAMYSLSTSNLRSTTLVEYEAAGNTLYGQTELLFGLSEDAFVGPVANVFDEEGFSRYQIGLRAEFDFGADDETILGLTATTGERTIGNADAERDTLFAVNVYRRF